MNQNAFSMVQAAILGSGNIGTDLMIKILRSGKNVRLAAMVGIDKTSEGLARAKKLGVPVTADGIEGLLAMPCFSGIVLVFDATSAGAHRKHEQLLRAITPDIQVIDLTPAAIGPFCVPVVNLDRQADALNLNMVTCGGQATIPIVYAISQVASVGYAEIVASIASASAGPGTRANIDEFTQTTARAIETVGGAKRGKAIIILNPAEPPLIMRDTVYCLVSGAGANDDAKKKIGVAVDRMVSEVRQYVPGYRLKQDVQFDVLGRDLKVTVLLEVEGAAHYLPAYAGNLDIMTSAALATAERLAVRRQHHHHPIAA
jgi:acetaldehyde dehydrogenase